MDKDTVLGFYHDEKMLVEEKDALKERLKEIFGYSQFRGNQETIIRNLLDGKNTFVIMPTAQANPCVISCPQ
jgi:ATP-dependent DNA helicase RecQ